MRAIDLARIAFTVGLIVPVSHAAEAPRAIKGPVLDSQLPGGQQI